MPRYIVPVIIEDIYHVTVEAKSRGAANRAVIDMTSSQIEQEGKHRNREVSTLVDETEAAA